MTRGPDSEKAIEWAAAIAALRGDVYFFRKTRDRPCDLQIVNGSEIIFVATKLCRRLYRPVGELEAEYEETVLRLRAVRNPAIDRQLWFFSRRGNPRIFRVTLMGMEELPAQTLSSSLVETEVKNKPVTGSDSLVFRLSEPGFAEFGPSFRGFRGFADGGEIPEMATFWLRILDGGG